MKLSLRSGILVLLIAGICVGIYSCSRMDSPEHWIKNQAISLDEVDKKGNTIAHLAAKEGRVDVLSFIKSEYPELLGIVNTMNLSICDVAANNGQLKVLQWLKGSGYKINGRVACSAASGGRLEILEWIKKEGIDWRPYSDSMLEGAAENGHIEVMNWTKKNLVKRRLLILHWFQDL